MTPLTSAPVTRARGLLAAVLDAGSQLDPIVGLEVAQALNELTPADAFPTYPARSIPVDDPAEAVREARRHLRTAVAAEGDLTALQQISAAIRCLDAALAAVTS